MFIFFSSLKMNKFKYISFKEKSLIKTKNYAQIVFVLGWIDFLVHPNFFALELFS